VTVDDLAFVEADAVVRPATHTLDPASPAAVRLDQMAGAAFEAQRRLTAPLEVGAAVVTPGGELAAPLVIHVVIRSDDENPDQRSIRQALDSAWHRAAEWGLARVAMPLLGAGAGQLSLEQAARMLASSLEAAGTRGGKPSEVTVVVDRADEYAIVDGALGGAASR